MIKNGYIITKIIIIILHLYFRKNSMKMESTNKIEHTTGTYFITTCISNFINFSFKFFTNQIISVDNMNKY